MNFARTLVKKGYALTEREALTKYLHKGGSAYVECSYPSFSVVAQKVHDAGGIVSLAHPAEYGLNDNGIGLGLGGENMMIPDSILENVEAVLSITSLV